MATVSDPQAQSQTATSQTGSAVQGWTPANPAPLGLSGFGFTTLVLSFINSNLVGAGSTPVVFGLALAFGGLGQIIAGLWEFRTGNTFGAVAFCSFGGFWISYFILAMFNLGQLGASTNSALGLYLWMWGAFTAMLFLCTFAAPRALSLLFLLLAATFVLLGIGNSGANMSIVHVGGYVGIATGAVAFYIACANIMEAVYGHSVLPIGAPAPRT